eukprot:m.64691 g.64691  ORF g.64691 m.64691 type:complete len:173 (+) comp8240_c0_seq3:121-639(+)
MAAGRQASRLQRFLIEPLKAWAEDYKRGVQSIGEWIKEGPVKAGMYAAATGTVWYTASNNIAESEYHAVVANCAAEIAEVPPALRNPSSETFVARANEARLTGRLRHLDLLVLSMFYVSDYPPETQLFKAQHYFFHEFVRTFHTRVTEVSLLGRTPMTDKAMIDYDVNNEEE